MAPTDVTNEYDKGDKDNTDAITPARFLLRIERG